MVDLSHPGGVAPSQIVVDGDDVDTFARERVEIGREGRDQGLALAGTHLGDLPVVEHHAADHLHVEVAQAERSLGCLAHNRECLGDQAVEIGTRSKSLAKLSRLRGQGLIREWLEFGLEGVDPCDGLEQCLDEPVIPAAEDLLEQMLDHRIRLRPVGKIPA